MVLVFSLLCIILIISILTILLLLSTIKIEILSLELSNIKEIIDQNYLIKISLNMFNKIKWITIKLDNKKIKKVSSKINMKKLNFSNIKGNLRDINFKILKRIKPNIEKLNLKIDVGVEDIIITSSLVFIITLIISNVLPHIVSKYNKNAIKYIIMPIYNKNIYYIKLDSIFSIKMVHIISIIYIYFKERKK